LAESFVERVSHISDQEGGQQGGQRVTTRSVSGTRSNPTGRFPFGLPQGWYVVASSPEVKPGQVVRQRYFERELAIYRTMSGEARVVDAFCPHMGAHLGRVGKVEGDLLRCGFHGFCYDTDGQCVSTAYGSLPPSRAKLELWPVREQNGLILTWFSPDGAPPHWEVPILDDTGFVPIRFKRFEIPTHPQETTENSVDFGHFVQLHGFVGGEITVPIEIDRHLLTSSYRAIRPFPVLGKYTYPVEYDVKVHGLGYSQVDVELKPFGWRFRIFVLPTPIDGENLHLRLGVCTSKRRLGPLLAPLLRRTIHDAVLREVGQDLDVWTYKTFVEKPALAKGDGPISPYRQYVKQFYPPFTDAEKLGAD
jgi:nitrite reductase/ring-hydroxylating ferredoxin subunit